MTNKIVVFIRFLTCSWLIVNLSILAGGIALLICVSSHTHTFLKFPGGESPRESLKSESFLSSPIYKVGPEGPALCRLLEPFTKPVPTRQSPCEWKGVEFAKAIRLRNAMNSSNKHSTNYTQGGQLDPAEGGCRGKAAQKSERP